MFLAIHQHHLEISVKYSLVNPTMAPIFGDSRSIQNHRGIASAHWFVCGLDHPEVSTDMELVIIPRTLEASTPYIWMPRQVWTMAWEFVGPGQLIPNSGAHCLECNTNTQVPVPELQADRFWRPNSQKKNAEIFYNRGTPYSYSKFFTRMTVMLKVCLCD